jgi:hypothetical protein
MKISDYLLNAAEAFLCSLNGPGISHGRTLGVEPDRSSCVSIRDLIGETGSDHAAI